jgi:hypothetical protein
LFVEGFGEIYFSLSSTKLSEDVQDIAFGSLVPDCSIQVLPFFLEALSAVFMCMHLLGTRVFDKSHCLSKVCVLAKKNSCLSVAFPGFKSETVGFANILNLI